MNLADSIERRFLFGIARGLFLSLVVVALGAIAVDLAALCLNRPTPLPSAPTLSAERILAMLPVAEAAYSTPADPGPLSVSIPDSDGYAVPTALHAAVVDDTNLAPVIGGWLRHIPATQRQAFLNGLGDVAALTSQRAAKWEWDDRQRYVAAGLSEYAQLHIERVDQAEQIRQAADAREHRYLISAVVLIVAVGGLTLILLLLAIERNTRAGLSPRRT
jgi:hypothetical protein